MKTFVALLLCSITAFCAGPVYNGIVIAKYNGTLDRGSGSEPIELFLYTDGTAEIDANFGASSVVFGKFTEKLNARQIFISTATNQFTGTIKNGVVRGTYSHFSSGTRGTFQCDPPR